MKFASLPAALALALPVQPLAAQALQTVVIPYGGTGGAPVSQTPANGPADTPEEIAKDAARDLKGSRFYNRPGATRAQYDADWQTCRLIARGSQTPSGSVPYTYNPAMVSPIAAGVGGAVGGLIAGAIAEGEQRRANRRACLLIKGWRLVELPSLEAARIEAMSDTDRDAYFNSIVGAETVKGQITARPSFTLEPDPVLKLDAPVAGAGTVFLGKKVDPAKAFALAPGEAAIVVAFRRPDSGSAGRSGTLQLVRYDMDKRDVVYRPRDWKKQGDKTTYLVDAKSGDKLAPHEVQVIRLTPGDYVLNSSAVGALLPVTSNCFGAPTFHANAGDVLYVGDFIPYWNVKLANGGRLSALAYTAKADETRKALASRQPALAEAMKVAALHNGATYSCSAITMDRWDVPGADMLPAAAPVAAN